MPTMTYTVPVTGIDPVEVTVTDYGAGQPFLLLHGGAGPQSVTGSPNCSPRLMTSVCSSRSTLASAARTALTGWPASRRLPCAVQTLHMI